MNNMLQKIKLAIWVFCCIAFVTSCHSHNESAMHLQRVSQLIDVYPDSALFILEQSIDSKQLTRKEHALWSLLLTKARDKSYIPHTSDSLIDIALKYYENSGDNDLLMEVYYYKGRVNHSMEKALQAQEYYLKALTIGEKSENHTILTRINYNIASLYLYQDVYEQALNYLRKTLEYTQINNDSITQSYALRNIARCFAAQNNQDSALVYYKEALRYTNEANKSSILNELGLTYQKLESYQESLSNLKEALRMIPESKKEAFGHIYLNLGTTYWKMNNYDSTAFHLNKAVKSRYIPTKAGALYYLSELTKYVGDTEKAYYYLKQFKVLNDSVNSETNHESLRKAQALYNHYKAENEMSRLKIAHMENRTYLLIAIIVIIFLLFLFIRLRKLFKVNKNELDETINNLKDKDSILKENAQRIIQLELFITKSKDEIRKLEAENEIFKKEQEEKALATNELKSSAIYEKFHSAFIKKKSSNEYIKNHEITDKDKEELKQAVEKAFPNFAARIRQQCSFLKEEELFLCYLCKINITSPTYLKNFFINITADAISMRKRRINKNLVGQEKSPEFFNQYIDSL